MWKLTKLFSLILLGLALAQPLKESISLKVKVIGKVVEEKPKLLPPERLEIEEEITYMDLSSRLLEPPKYIEEAQIEPPPEGKGCGEPKDRAYYRAGVRYYLKGDLKRAESRMLDLLSLQNSPFIPQAQYILGLIYAQTDRDREALEFFKSSCEVPHPYEGPACEAYYALEFKLSGQPVEAESPDLWRKVYQIKTEGRVEAPSCEDTVFQDYCSYVRDFAQGNVNEDYPESTELRRAIVLIGQNSLEGAREILLRHSKPLSKYRNEALYYLGVVSLLEGNRKLAYRYASLLETTDPELSKNLYLIISKGDILLSRIAYQLTGSKEVLRSAGILSYNSGKFDLAYAEFTKAGEHFLAALAALQEGDYGRAYRSLKESRRKDRDYYLWLLEVLYWLGKDEEMEEVLNQIRERFPDLYREYYGWLMFKKERWLEAYKYFEDPYHRALALYNAGRYKEVLNTLKEANTLKERILKAKAALSLGKGRLARSFLTDESPEEIYLKGLSYFIEGRYREAIPYFERLLKEDALRSRAMLRLADSHYNLGDYERARRIYREILTLYPDSKEALDATLALAQIELQHPSPELENLIKEFVRKFPDSPLVPDLRYQLANLYLKEGKEEEARRILEDLLKVEPLKGKVLVKLAQLEEDPAEKEELLKEAIKVSEGKDKEKAMGMLMSLYLQRKEFEKLADFLVQGDFDDKKKALDLYMEENLQKAIDLFERLISERPEDEELKEEALKLYEKTKGKKYLLIARESENKKVKAKALYLLGRIEKKKDKRKALERFVEVVLTAEGAQPYYNRSILEAVDILVSLKARKDASCLLEKLDPRYLTKRDIKKVKILRKKLPKCEVKK